MSSIARATRRALAVAAMICGVATGAGAHHAAAPVFDLNAEKTVRITVTFRPLRDGKAGGMFITGKLEDGKVVPSAS
jgi:hypothetical protein